MVRHRKSSRDSGFGTGISGLLYSISRTPSSPLKKCATAGLSSSECGKTLENTVGQAGSGTRNSQNRLFQLAASPQPRTPYFPAKLSAAIVFLLIAIIQAGEATAVSIGDMPADKILFLGNSITYHPPKPEIGWTGDWGMDASSRENDYAHLVASYVTALNGGTAPDVTAVNIFNYGGFEQKYATYDAETELYDLYNWEPDIVVFELGDNSTASLTTQAARDAFAAGMADVLSVFKNRNQPEMFVVSTFWPSTITDGILRQACSDAGGAFVDISMLYQNSANRGGWGGHPSDAGMAAIAGRVWGAMVAAQPFSGQVVSVDVENNPASSGSVTYWGQGAIPAAGNVWNSFCPTVEPAHAYYGDFAQISAISSGTLLDCMGNPTALTATITGMQGTYSWLGYDPYDASVECTSHHDLMHDWAINDSTVTDAALTINGLTPGGLYDLVLYGHSHEGEGNETFTVGGLTKETNYIYEKHILTAGVDYAAFDGVRADGSGRINVGFRDAAGGKYGGLNGFQISEASGQAQPAQPAVSDLNLLSGISAAGTLYEPNWLPRTATDGKGGVTDGVQCDWVSPTWDGNPRLALWGIEGELQKIRIWGSGDLDPDEVEIRSSTSLIAPTTGAFAANLADSYETVLLEMTSTAGAWIAAGMTGDQPWQMYYIEYLVSAPAGTQSLLFDFGDSGRTRIVEVQGFLSSVLPGDADNNGTVDADDAALLAANWLTTGNAAWCQGDFNGDGNVDDLDAAILAANWLRGVAPDAAVPEPSTLALLWGLAVGLSVYGICRPGKHEQEIAQSV